MGASAKKIISTRKTKVEEVIAGFDPEKLKAPFLLRCGAFLVDYIVIVIVPVGSLLLARLIDTDPAKLLNGGISNVGWLITFFLAIANFLIFPVFRGQSIGKMVAGLRITKLDGKTPGLNSIILRHFAGYPLTLLTGGLGYMILIFSKKGMALHDYLGRTVVVYGRTTIYQKKAR